MKTVWVYQVRSLYCTCLFTYFYIHFMSQLRTRRVGDKICRRGAKNVLCQNLKNVDKYFFQGVLLHYLKSPQICAWICFVAHENYSILIAALVHGYSLSTSNTIGVDTSQTEDDHGVRFRFTQYKKLGSSFGSRTSLTHSVTTHLKVRHPFFYRNIPSITK